jgi:hypothetical protein
MTVDPRLIGAELRAGELLALLAAAVAGAPHWRGMATVLLDEIENYVLPERRRGAARGRCSQESRRDTNDP